MRTWVVWRLFAAMVLVLPLMGGTGRDLEHGFRRPPDDARPWVYWFWLNGNITSNGITADLEAMKRVGIGGVLIMEVDQGAPLGPVPFMSAEWRKLFRHVVTEADRLGLEVNLNNDAGWNGSGGPWIRPEQSMQKVVCTETNLTGPGAVDLTLARPEVVAGYCRDIAVLAFPTVGDYRLDRVRAKAGYEVAHVGGWSPTNLPPDQRIAPERMVDLTSRMDADGRLRWDVPAGAWTVLRFAHTSTGAENAPAPASGRGLECDKLSPEGIEANFAGMMSKVIDDAGRLAGRTLVATHIDSWENGAQNWTARMRAEFRARRGYDLFPYLPVLTGRVVEAQEISERFLWDLRRAISELVVEHYAGRMRQLAAARGLRFTVEAYGSPCDCLPYAGQSDEPMGEFWSPSGGMETCRGMASAAHVYGKRIVGAEAFTAGDLEKWLEHPGSLKALGDRAFCEGINRFVFHRYALQPWREERRPGMTMGPWGQHYERTQTWWEWSGVWHEYLARCQFLLRQGLFVADVCYLQAEAPPQGFAPHNPQGYAWDECDAAVVRERMSVRDGRLVLPDGMSYRVLVLPEVRTMTPELLRKLQELVAAGATIVGARPLESPSLSGYPECDAEVRRLGAALWGDCDGQRVKEHRFGQGRVVWGIAPEKLLRQMGVPPDFVSGQPLRYLHRGTGKAEIYFVANSEPHAVHTTASFRVAGQVPEFWWPESGHLERAAMFHEETGVTHVPLSLEASGSVFVVFRKSARKVDPVVRVTRNDRVLLAAAPDPPVKVVVHEARYGVLEDPARVRDVTSRVQEKVDAGDSSFAVGTMAEGDDPAAGTVKSLAVVYTIEGTTFRVRARDMETIHLSREAVTAQVEKARYGVLGDPKRTRDVRDKVQRLLDAGESRFTVARMAQGDDPAFLVVKTLELEYRMDGRQFRVTGTDPETISLAPVRRPPESIVQVRVDSGGRVRLEARESGSYLVAFASGRTQRWDVESVPAPVEVVGPWEVRFAGGGGAPEFVRFDRLVDWSTHPDPGVKYFSGGATYRHQLTLPHGWLGRKRRLWLDLGQVAVMARVKLNGRELGTLWKPPYRVEITEVAKAGRNSLEIEVVNLWVNRMIGDEQLAEDSDRNPDGTLKAWPGWLVEGLSSPAGRHTFTTWRLWKQDSALQKSGLLGPVRVMVTSR